MEESPSTGVCALLGPQSCFKTTMILHYGYLFVNATIDRNGQTADKDAQVDPNVQGLVVCSQQQMKQNSFYFGKYSKLQIQVVKAMKMKYIESYEELVRQLSLFPLIELKPQFIFVDNLSQQLQAEQDSRRRNSKRALLLQLLNNVMLQMPRPRIKENKIFYNVMFNDTIVIRDRVKDGENEDLAVISQYSKHVFQIQIEREEAQDTERGAGAVQALNISKVDAAGSDGRLLQEYQDPNFNRILRYIRTGVIRTVQQEDGVQGQTPM